MDKAFLTEKANFYHTAGEYAEGKKARGEI